jgi:hypothetical protein
MVRRREHLRVINPATEALLTTVNGGDERALIWPSARPLQRSRLVENQRCRTRRDPAQHRQRRAQRS